MIAPVEKFIQKYGRLPTEYDPDYLEMLHMGKFRILDVPDVSPGKCSNCGASKQDGRRYIDIGLHIDWYGAFYLCGLCLNELAEAMGLYAHLKDDIAELRSQLEAENNLWDQGFQLRETVTHLFEEFEEFYANLPYVSVDDNPDNFPAVDSKESNSEQGISEAESGTTKSSASSRSKNVRGLADLIDSSGNEK